MITDNHTNEATRTPFYHKKNLKVRKFILRLDYCNALFEGLSKASERGLDNTKDGEDPYKYTDTVYKFNTKLPLKFSY